jgi:hypothetical protein
MRSDTARKRGACTVLVYYRRTRIPLPHEDESQAVFEQSSRDIGHLSCAFSLIAVDGRVSVRLNVAAGQFGFDITR